MRGGVRLEYTLARNSRPLPGVIDLFRKLEHVLLIYVQIPLYNVLNPEGDKEEREKEAESTTRVLRFLREEEEGHFCLPQDW